MINRHHMKFLHDEEPFRFHRDFTSSASNTEAEHFVLAVGNFTTFQQYVQPLKVSFCTLKRMKNRDGNSSSFQ